MLIIPNISPQQQETPLLNSSTCSHDAVVLDLTHGFLSGVDREGRNIKSASKQADIETKIKKKNAFCDANLIYLKRKYEYEHEWGG